MTEIPDWAADMVEANEALGDKLDRALLGIEDHLQGGQCGAQGVGEPRPATSHTSHRNGQAQSGPAATGRYTRCDVRVPLLVA